MREIVIKEHTLDTSLIDGNRPLKVIDLGACQGEFTNALALLFPMAYAMLVEPNPTNFAKIVPHPAIQRYGLCTRPVAGISNQQVDFIEDVDSPYNGTTKYGWFTNQVVHKLVTISLADLLTDAPEGPLDILKVDVEGSEYDILLNTPPEVLQRFTQITVEFHDFLDPTVRPQNAIVIARMHSLGFEHVSKPINYMHGSDNYDTLFYKPQQINGSYSA